MCIFFLNRTLFYTQGKFTLLNSDGLDHLSKDEGPLLFIYKALACLWLVMLLMWIVNWIQYRQVSNFIGSLYSFLSNSAQ